MATIKLANGVTIEGTPEQVATILKSLGITYKGDKKFYLSESKGLLLISEMNTIHLKNAILKWYGQWVNDLHKITNPAELVLALTDGIVDPTFEALIAEYAGRKEE